MKDLEIEYYLIANSKVVTKGSLYHCLNNLWRVKDAPKEKNGVGSWIIVDEEGGERESGWYCKNAYWFASQASLQ